ncbi:hypothetical protein SAMN05444156_1457 [Verrucomicrobium sp. GAS474]|uniref:hypothetical protein n=1 Tax=Verrucomicrobium sp. GAS474 TaxID=1882831 RepID=UPI00087ACE84|nr:hypothetical protein [Verrucomicrobium sp. GAS474]SDU01553.1 hypothetical protein SAMN05444156_1457 [Verrucomicrobium sp. GAS474]
MTASLRALFGRGISVGLRAGRENLVPGLVIQAITLLIVVGYYRGWPTTALLTTLADLKVRYGHLFSFVATGLFAGVLGEACRVLFLQRGRFAKANLEEMVFRFFLLGFCGIGSDFLYLGLGALLGNAPSPLIVAEKVAIDQFVYSAFLACPFLTLGYHWKHSGYRLAALGDLFRPAFIGEQVVPLTLSNFCFWIPTTVLIYSLPVLLQLPLFLLAVTIWGLLLVSISTRRGNDGKLPVLPAEETVLPI